MAEVAKLVGMEMRSYTGSDGAQKSFCGLHFCHLEDTVRDVKGCKCENVSCPRELDPATLKIGQTYELVYEIYQTKNGKGARLVDLEPVEA